MKTILLYAFFQSCLLFSFGQLDSSSVKILDTILRLEQPAGTIIYTDKLKTIYADGIKKIAKDLDRKKFFLREETSTKSVKNILSLKEKEFLKRELNKAQHVQWQDSLFHDSKRIPEDSMWDHISSKNSEFYKNYAMAVHNKDSTFINNAYKVRYSNVFQFSPLIYLRKNTIFLLYILRLCGSNCGIEELCFYQLQNGSYKKWVGVSGGVF